MGWYLFNACETAYRKGCGITILDFVFVVVVVALEWKVCEGSVFFLVVLVH